jgi:hypothetical protein
VDSVMHRSAGHLSALQRAVASRLGTKLVTVDGLDEDAAWEWVGSRSLHCDDCAAVVYLFVERETMTSAIVCTGCRAAWNGG